MCDDSKTKYKFGFQCMPDHMIQESLEVRKTLFVSVKTPTRVVGVSTDGLITDSLLVTAGNKLKVSPSNKEK